MCVSRCAYEYVQCPWRSEGGVGTNGIEVTGSCELLDMHAGNQTQALCKCGAHSSPQRHLLSPSGCGLMKWKRLYVCDRWDKLNHQNAAEERTLCEGGWHLLPLLGLLIYSFTD